MQLLCHKYSNTYSTRTIIQPSTGISTRPDAIDAECCSDPDMRRPCMGRSKEWVVRKNTGLQVCGSNKLVSRRCAEACCHFLVSFDRAKELCASTGPRLCTKNEIIKDQVRFGTGCNLAKVRNGNCGQMIGRARKNPTAKRSSQTSNVAAGVCCSVSTSDTLVSAPSNPPASSAPTPRTSLDNSKACPLTIM